MKMQLRVVVPVIILFAIGVALWGHVRGAWAAASTSAPAGTLNMNGEQLAIWTFDGSPVFRLGEPMLPTAASGGAPVLTMFDADIDDNGKDGRDYTDVVGVAHPADRAAAWNDIKKKDAPDAELIIQLDTTEWSDLALRFDYKSESASGYNLDYSIDGGGAWVPILVQEGLVADDAWQTEAIDLASWDALDHQGRLWLRINHLEDTGNDKFVFDNLEISGARAANQGAPTIEVTAGSAKTLRLPVTGGGQLSGVVDDPTDPALQYGIDFLLSDLDTPASGLTISAVASNTGVVAEEGLTWTGSGARRTLHIRPQAAGISTITVEVSDGAHTSTYVIQYAASAADPSPTTARFHTGMSDASSAIAVDAKVMFVANDEMIDGRNLIYLFDRQQSGAPLRSFDFTDRLELGGREMDLEASTRLGNTIFWLSSLGNNKDGECRSDRQRLFGTWVAGKGAGATLSYRGRYDYLRDDLIAWDSQNQHGLGANYYGFAASAACAPAGGIQPKRPDGLNVEGLVLAPDNTTGYVAFRAPISPAHERSRALIVPVANVTGLLNRVGGGVAGSARFGAPIELDLGGRGIRSIERNAAAEYLLIAGPSDSANDFRLYRWSGKDPRVTQDPADNPVELVNLTALGGMGSWEGIVQVPSPLIGPVQLITDNGTTDWYGTGSQSKALPPNYQKFRSQWVAW